VMALLDELRGAIHAGLVDTSRTGISLRNTAPGGRETTVNTRITYEWTLEPPESGWTLVGYEYCFEGWYKPIRSYDIDYRGGYTTGDQPRPQWTSAVATTTSASFTPTKPGHYTFHVRAILRNGTAERRSAYAGDHTFLVQ